MKKMECGNITVLFMLNLVIILYYLKHCAQSYYKNLVLCSIESEIKSKISTDLL